MRCTTSAAAIGAASDPEETWRPALRVGREAVGKGPVAGRRDGVTQVRKEFLQLCGGHFR